MGTQCGPLHRAASAGCRLLLGAALSCLSRNRRKSTTSMRRRDAPRSIVRRPVTPDVHATRASAVERVVRVIVTNAGASTPLARPRRDALARDVTMVAGAASVRARPRSGEPGRPVPSGGRTAGTTGCAPDRAVLRRRRADEIHGITVSRRTMRRSPVSVTKSFASDPRAQLRRSRAGTSNGGPGPSGLRQSLHRIDVRSRARRHHLRGRPRAHGALFPRHVLAGQGRIGSALNLKPTARSSWARADGLMPAALMVDGRCRARPVQSSTP